MDGLLPETAGERGPLTEYLGYALRRAQLRVFADVIDALGEIDLRPAQFSVLAVIDANPGVLQSHACAKLGIQKANFVPLLHGLQRRGLLRRVARDGRANGLHLTDAGRALLRRARRIVDAHERRVTARLSDAERARLMRTLKRIAGLDAEAATRRPPAIPRRRGVAGQG